MTRRLVGSAVLLLTVLLVQTTVLPILLRPGFLPDLATVLAVLVTVERGPRAGLWIAAAGGLLSDLLATSVPLGSGVAIAVGIAAAAGLLRPYLGDRRLVVVPMAGLGATGAFLAGAVLRAVLATESAVTPALLAAGAVATGALGVVAAVPLLLLLDRVLPASEARSAGAFA